MYKISGRRLHYIAAKSKFNWKDRPLAYLRDWASCEVLNGILDKDKFIGHKESICGKYALRPSKGKWNKAKLFGNEVYNNREKYIKRDDKSDRLHKEKHINNKRVRYLLKEETKQLLKEIL